LCQPFLIIKEQLMAVIDFKLGIYAPNGCLLYEETQSSDLSQSNGQFSLKVGQGVRTSSDLGLSLTNAFANSGVSLVPASANCSSGYTPASGDARSLRVTLTPQGTGTPVTLSPDLVIGSVPNSMVAETLQGLPPSSFIQNQSSVSQSNLTNLTNGSDASALHNHDSLYVKLGSNPSFSQVTVSSNPSTSTSAVNLGYLQSALSGLTTSNIAQGSNLYYTTAKAQTDAKAALSASAPLSYSLGNFSLSQATASSNGYVSSSDWSLFNNKYGPTSSVAAGSLLMGNSSGILAPVAMSGDASLSSAGALTLAASGVTAGTYSKVAVNTKGQVTSGASLGVADLNPATVNGSFVSNAVSVPLSSGSTFYLSGATTTSTITLNTTGETNGAVSTIIVDSGSTAGLTYNIAGCSTRYYAPAATATDQLTISGTKAVIGITTVQVSSNLVCFISWSSFQ
jgi:hypothetical protein